MIRFSSIILLSILCLPPLSFAQSAKQVCVSCQGPDAIYLCDVRSKSIVNDTALGLYCIVKISKTHRHNSCSLTREKPVRCKGPRISLTYGTQIKKRRFGNSSILPPQQDAYDNGEITTGVLLEQSPADSIEPEEKPTEITNEEPKTLIDLTKQVSKNTGKQLKKAGEALNETGNTIADTAKKSLKCLTSLFSDC